MENFIIISMLVVAWIATQVGNIYAGFSALLLLLQNKGKKSTIFYGFLISLISYCLIFLSVATISHNPRMSIYGYKFACFYFLISCCYQFILYMIAQSIFYNNKSKSTKSVENIIYAYQVSFAIWTLMPFIVFALLMNKLGVLTLFLKIFELSKNAPEVYQLFSHISSPSLGITAYFLFIILTASNGIIAFPIIHRFKVREKENALINH